MIYGKLSATFHCICPRMRRYFRQNKTYEKLLMIKLISQKHFIPLRFKVVSLVLVEIHFSIDFSQLIVHIFNSKYA